ncbi:hypothetical protein [Delftia sp. CH05]|uniref:hypothetical protein n=1 Tax=Delftia sp. CH05 TaxID=2692194 RepID=UPI00135E3E5B|nr:hypothetical protein [Delftia sp. CH05]MXN31339.1 hypothetical protein [Delftia sp. CH05]
MASVKMEEIVDHLSTEVRRALENSVRQVAPDARIDSYELFQAFRREIGRRCSTWEKVPDHYVEK